MLTRPGRLSLLPAFFLTAPLASADLLLGRVVDDGGAGVQGVDIDAKDLSSGDDVELSNDGTDANGDFAVTIPPGFYEISFNPPPPPLTTHLVLEVDNVIVAGTSNLGTVALPPGVAVSGRTLDSSGLPVAGVDLDAVDLTTGDSVDLIGDKTDALGDFIVAVPLGLVEVRIDTTTLFDVQVYAPQAFELDLSADVDLGDLTLLDGYFLTGTVTGPGGGEVVGADLDVSDSATNFEYFTPGDNTDGSGFFDVVVPAGTFDIEICPKTADELVTAELTDVVVTGDTDLGTISLLDGVFLTGTVTDSGGSPLQGIDIDVRDSVSGLKLPLCSDNTNASGQYSVIVPEGTLDVVFDPSYSVPYGEAVTTSVLVSGATNVNGAVPDCPFGTNYGTGLAGTGGVVPSLHPVGGTPRVGNSAWGFGIEDALGASPALLLLGVAPLSVPFWGGTLLVNPVPVFTFLPVVLGGGLGLPGAGAGSLAFPLPITADLVGITIYGQGIIQDFAAPNWFALTDGMSATFCP